MPNNLSKKPFGQHLIERFDLCAPKEYLTTALKVANDTLAKLDCPAVSVESAEGAYYCVLGNMNKYNTAEAAGEKAACFLIFGYWAHPENVIQKFESLEKDWSNEDLSLGEALYYHSQELLKQGKSVVDVFEQLSGEMSKKKSIIFAQARYQADLAKLQ